jgi:hypothetical protein
MSNSNVSEGNLLHGVQRLAAIGSTGNSIGSHHNFPRYTLSPLNSSYSSPRSAADDSSLASVSPQSNTHGSYKNASYGQRNAQVARRMKDDLIPEEDEDS